MDIDLKIATGIKNFMKNSKIKVPNLKNEPLTTPMPHPSKNLYRQNALKIDMETKNDTRNSKIVVPRSKNHRFANIRARSRQKLGIKITKSVKCGSI